MSRPEQMLPPLPIRRPDAHKGEFGHVLVVACSPGMSGAGCLAAAATQRAGAGLVTLALPRSLNSVVETSLWSAMSLPLPETDTCCLGSEAARTVLRIAARFDVFAIGPGLGRAEETGQMVRTLLRELQAPAVVDADGLNALAGHVEVLKPREHATVLTPHPGEMSRLAGIDGASRVQEDREGVARSLARQTGSVVVLKGHESVVTDGERSYVNHTGNPGMATGGMGDVLTGLIAGLLCQGLDAFGAACLGVFVHGLAGDLAARRTGHLALIPEDVLSALPRVLRIVEQESASRPDAPLDPNALARRVFRTQGG